MAYKYSLDHNARDPEESTFLASRPWRQGRKVPRNVYAQVSDDPSDSDVAIGQFDSEWLAFAAVNGHNAEVVYHPAIPCENCGKTMAEHDALAHCWGPESKTYTAHIDGQVPEEGAARPRKRVSPSGSSSGEQFDGSQAAT